MDTVMVVSAIVGSVSFWELVKYLFHRRANRRKADSEADASEFSVLRETVVFLQEQLHKKEERFAAQTEVVRRLNAENLELVREVTTLKTERGLKLCERRNCLQREPQSGY